MNAREALEAISVFIDDADSFIQGFDEEFLYGMSDEDYDEDGNIKDRRPIDPDYEGPSVTEALEVLATLIEQHEVKS